MKNNYMFLVDWIYKPHYAAGTFCADYDGR